MVRYVLNSRAEAPRRGSHTRCGRPPGRTERGRQPPRPLCRARGYPPWERRSCCRTPRQTSRCQFLCRRQAHHRCLPRTLFRSASQCRHFLDTFDREDAALARKEAEKPKPQGEAPSAAPDVPPATPVKEKKVKTLLARDLMPQSVVILREEKDIDDYLAKLRQKLEEALKNADEIKLR